MTTLLWILVALNAVTLLAGWRLYSRTREAPDGLAAAASEATARHLRELEARERWTGLDLERLHPINREEVVALLRRLEGGSSGSLTSQERAFLDRMVEAEQRARRGARRAELGADPHPHGA